MSVKVITRAVDLAPYAVQWNALAAPFRTPVLSYEWICAAAGVSEFDGDLRIVLVLDDDNSLAAAASLAAPRTGLSPALEFLGNPLCKLYEPSGFIYRDEAALDQLIGALSALGKPLKLAKLPDQPAIRSAFDKARAHAMLAAPTHARSLFAPRPDDWAVFEQSMSKSSRETLKRRRKAAEQVAPVSMYSFAPSAEEYRVLLAQFLTIESSGWKGRARTDIQSNPYQKAFFETYGEVIANQGVARVFKMLIGDEVAAMRLAVVHSGALWELKIAFDEKFQRCGPGVLLTHETLRYVFENNLDGHEFLGSDEAWERVWTDTTREYVSYQLFPYSAAGLAGYGGLIGQAALARSRLALASVGQRALARVRRVLAPVAKPVAPPEAPVP